MMKPTKAKYEGDLEALRRNLEKCDENIRIFREAIDKELETKARLKMMIEELEKRARSGI